MKPGRSRALWVSTSPRTRGGIATYVRSMKETPLWSEWSVRHVATHQDGSLGQRMLRFGCGAASFVAHLVLWRPNVVHLHSASSGSFARKSMLAWVSRVFSVPVVLHIHGGGFGDFHDRSPAPWRRYIRATLEGVDAVIALGPTWAERLQGIAPDARVIVVPNAVAPRPRSRCRSEHDELVVLFLGRVGGDKGVPLLLDAWSLVVDELPRGTSARLVVAGDGEVERFQRLAAERGVASIVDFLGWVTTGRVEELLEQADVLVLPSRWEGHPMAILEAMAHGIPVVATAVGGIPDLVDHRSGLLVGPDEVEGLMRALVQLLASPRLRDELGAGGLQRVRDDFDIEHTWRVLDDLYNELAR